jgi:hypothetical protein
MGIRIYKTGGNIFVFRHTADAEHEPRLYLCSDTPLMLNTSHVPQHLLLMSCVLRYIMTQNTVLRKPG